ncbi:mechanosensitive ion channel family protein [Aquirhabdus sp.]|uniref:mechanosensitive ion channel family protein n=1 Tax=Aquirhabdus sp. TaxID=2824160 RepID=UPI00396CBCF3
MNNFLDQLVHAFQQSLFYSLGAPNSKNVDWADLPGLILSKGIITLALLLTLYLIYITLNHVISMVKRRSLLGSSTIQTLRVSLKLIWLFTSLIALFSQLGVELSLLRATARAAIALLGFYLLWVIIIRLMNKTLKKFYLDESINQLFNNILTVVIVVFALASILSQFGFNMMSIVAGLGIAGVAVGFAAQATLANFIAGITILLERPFRIGDWVSINNKDGQVMLITLRTTRIRTRDNLYLILPNSTVAAAEVTNYTSHGAIRFSITCRLAYHDSISKARQVIHEVLEKDEHILKHPAPLITAQELSESHISLIVRFWIDPIHIETMPRICETVREEIQEALLAAEMKVPFPRLQVMTPITDLE